MDNLKYTCECCGKTHESWPAIAFQFPDNYYELSEIEKTTICEVDSDFCIITRPEQTDRFIRCTYTQKVNEHCEDLEYGMWVSLSETSFRNYEEIYGDKDSEQREYFGWLCTYIPDYEFSESIPTTVRTRKNGERPEIIPHETFEHDFVRDYYEGISKNEAERRINKALGIVDERKNKKEKKKPWWKF